MAEKIRYFHIVEAFGGGVFYSVSQLCQYLSPETFDITLVYSLRPEVPEKWQRFFPDHVRRIPLPMVRELNLWEDLRSLWALLRLLEGERPDVVHLHSSKAGFLGRLACRLLSLPVVLYSPRGFSFLRQDVSPWKRRMFLALEWLAARFGGTIVALSQEELEWSKKLTPFVRHIPNGVPPTLPSQVVSPAEVFSSPLVGTNGRISPQKNPTLFVEIASRIDGKAHFLWIGDGELRHIVESAPVPIHITGWKGREEGLGYTSQLDVYLQTSLWEGMPVSILEAMALGKPVVATDIVGNRDLVHHGQTGFLAKEADDLAKYVQELLEDEELRARMGRAAKEMVWKKYTMGVIASQYEQLVKELLRRCGRL